MKVGFLILFLFWSVGVSAQVDSLAAVVDSAGAASISQDTLKNISSQRVGTIRGIVTSDGKPVPLASISVVAGPNFTTNDDGSFSIAYIPPGSRTLSVSAVGFEKQVVNVPVVADSTSRLTITLKPSSVSLDDVVVTGTMKVVSRSESTVPVEVFSSAFFRKNPTPSIFDALQNINGVRPQLNCNVCNTGDVHINGLEGPYTMILIDGMPIVSGLSSVYGLSGIPNALIERVEVVKGPASSLYGSEAVGGLINIITKKVQSAPVFSGDVFGTSWSEWNTDLGFKSSLGEKTSILTGVNYFKYGNRKDENRDNFTDVTLQDRLSVFQKWNFVRPENRLFSLAGRFNYEDRWGGDVSWNKGFRGGNQVYGESIYTNRWELIGNYQLPVDEKLLLAFSYNSHQQNSVYGDISYQAKQNIAFSQLTWDKKIGRHDLLLGTALRYTFYDDNTPATANSAGIANQPDRVWLPGLFVQDEVAIADKQKVLLGMRYDHNSVHGSILTPRVGYKLTLSDKDIIRFNAGTGFRVVSLFTEEHAALTGGREVLVAETLKPERSINANINYLKKIYLNNSSFIGFDGSVWYTRFQNQILPDYETDPQKIIYSNLAGYAISRGISGNLDFTFTNGLKILAGGSLLDVFSKEENRKQLKRRPFLTERWTGTWSVSYKINKLNLSLDYTGNIYGPMRLPTTGENDLRRTSSPVWSIQNVQFTYSRKSLPMEIYGGVKNLLNWTPARNQPYLIARSQDPFERNPQFDSLGSFDPSYVYAPNQGMRSFLGVRVNLK